MPKAQLPMGQLSILEGQTKDDKLTEDWLYMCLQYVTKSISKNTKKKLVLYAVNGNLIMHVIWFLNWILTLSYLVG
jgi:hypothetical protein